MKLEVAVFGNLVKNTAAQIVTYDVVLDQSDDSAHIVVVWMAKNVGLHIVRNVELVGETIDVPLYPPPAFVHVLIKFLLDLSSFSPIDKIKPLLHFDIIMIKTPLWRSSQLSIRCPYSLPRMGYSISSPQALSCFENCIPIRNAEKCDKQCSDNQYTKKYDTDAPEWQTLPFEVIRSS